MLERIRATKMLSMAMMVANTPLSNISLLVQNVGYADVENSLSGWSAN